MRCGARACGQAAKSATRKPPPCIPTVPLPAGNAAACDAVRGALPSLRLTFEATAQARALFRQLGAPPGGSSDVNPESMLGDAIRAAARHARDLAIRDVADPLDEVGSA